MPLVSFLSFIVTGFSEANEGNYYGEHVKYFANHAADGSVIHVVNYPKRGNAEKLCYANRFAVARPHSERAAALRYKEKRGNPPFFAENEAGNHTRSGKAKFHKEKIEFLFAFIAQGKDYTAHNAEYVEQHSRPGGKECELNGKSDTASHLEKEIVTVFLALVRNERARRAHIADELHGVEYVK